MDATLQDFGRTHFGSAQLGDARRTSRLIRVADRMMSHPGGTLPQKMSTPADLKALYRLADCEQVTHQAVLATHQQRTLEAMSQDDGVVLTIHDTVQLDYTGKKSLKKLGQIATGFHRGYLCHNTLAVKAENGEVIGLASQILHVRPRVPKKETRAQRLGRADRESRLWKRGSEAVGAPPPGCTWVDLCDRGGDLFEYLDHKRKQGGKYVVRSQHDRRVWIGPNQSIESKLRPYARSLPTLGSWELSISANGKQDARKTKVGVACAKITLPPTPGENDGLPLEVWVVHVRELTPPAGDKPKDLLEWVLLTNVPTQSFTQARERVGWYEMRPIIEEYHKAQKTGCGIELPQFTDESRLEPIIAVTSVVAVQLLRLRDAARSPEMAAQPATNLVPQPWVRMLNIWRWHKPQRKTGIGEFCLALARLGGHLNRKSDGPPGWLTLWRGWQNLRLMVEAAEAIEKCG
jgi:hypothetical protein